MLQTPPLPNVHIVVMQPAGYVHSLGLLDPARFVRHQLRRFGVDVTMAKNRLRADALNIVLGAHLGFPAEWRERHACLFLNLEQLGPGGASVSPAYLELLKTSGVIDYDLANIGAYGADPADVPLIPFRHASYLEAAAASAPVLEDRPIDLLFFGSMNERRQRLISRIEACGLQVAMFDHPLYGEERDRFIRQAKAVLNCHFYESATFEQVRAFHCLSLGTPVIAERSAHTRPDTVFEQAVAWFDETSLETYFTRTFGTPQYFEEARRQLQAWRCHDPIDAYADLMAFAAGYFSMHANSRPAGAWKPACINLGSGKDYKPSWLNLDVLARAEPDLVLDLGQPQEFPLRATSRFGLEVEISPGSVEKVYANNVLEHVPDLPRLMGNVLTLLKEGGEIEIEVPYEKAPTAWQDPTHIRAMNENSWIYYTDWFWYLGWFEHRFTISASQWLDAALRPCARDQAAFMRVSLAKVQTSPYERTIARTMQPGIEEFDSLPVEHQDGQGYSFTNDWFEAQRPVVDKLLGSADGASALRILEIGAHEGRSTVHYIDHYLHHPDSRIVSIDPHDLADTTSPLTEQTRAIFDRNIRRSRYPGKSRLLSEFSQTALPKMVVSGEKYDYISIDGSHLSKDVLLDACLSFELLRDGGIILFDDYLGGGADRRTNPALPTIGIDSFLAAYAGHYKILHQGYHLAIQKCLKVDVGLTRKVVDCFLFFNELEMLRLRLEELKDVVDVFVLVESRWTFSGESKPLYFDQHKSEFAEYNIVHIILDGPCNSDPWQNEAAQRNACQEYVRAHFSHHDIVLLCDLDEIPNPAVVESAKLAREFHPAYLEMDLYYYNFAWLKKAKWSRAAMVDGACIEAWNIEDIRSRRAGIDRVLSDGGWHLSYFMSAEQIRQKIRAFSHQEFNTDEFTAIENIEKAIRDGRDLFCRGLAEDLVPRRGQKLPRNWRVVAEQVEPLSIP